MTATVAPSVAWLTILQRLAARVAHEIKNPLNAVAVNLEVVRSRAERERVDAPSIVPYAQAAAQELERTTRLVEALLALTRECRPDLNAVAAPLVVLYDALAAAEGGSVTLDPSDEEAGIDLAADDARAAIAATLDEMLGPNVRVRIGIDVTTDVVARFTGPATAPALPAGVRFAADSAGATLIFPARSRGIETA